MAEPSQCMAAPVVHKYAHIWVIGPSKCMLERHTGVGVRFGS
jgi:hypothetical protein